jgi:sigma-E factor negative regulatory protein RseA
MCAKQLTNLELESGMPDQEANDPDDEWQVLSALADGSASAQEQLRCMALWRERGDVRERWHQYQLIGDVMRSQELAADPSRDAVFVCKLRAKLAHEPVPLSPEQAASRRVAQWTGPVAAAAGVAAVAVALVVLRPATPVHEPVAAAAAARASEQVATAEPQLRVVNGQLIRDARLDRYFAAHRQSAGGAALQLPGAAVRSVDTIVLENR